MTCWRHATASGGKMRTDIVGGHHADLGAHWIGPTQDRVAALARELGVRTEPPARSTAAPCWCRAGGGARFAGRCRRSRRCRIAELGIAQLRLDRLRRKVSVDQPWIHAAVTDWDAQTVDTFARRYLRTTGCADVPQPRHGARVRRRDRGAFAPVLPLLSPVGRRAHLADRVRGRRPAGPLRGRQPAALRPAGGAARR